MFSTEKELAGARGSECMGHTGLEVEPPSASLAVEYRERVWRTDPGSSSLAGRWRPLQLPREGPLGNTVAGPSHRAPWCWMLGAPVPGDGQAAAPRPHGPQGPCLGLMLFKMITHEFSSMGLPEGPRRVHGWRTELGLESTELAEAGHRVSAQPTARRPVGPLLLSMRPEKPPPGPPLEQSLC